MFVRNMTLVLTILIVSCQTPQPESVETDQGAASVLRAPSPVENLITTSPAGAVEETPLVVTRATTLKTETILPPAFAVGLDEHDDEARFIVPGEMLLAAKVARPRAEVRAGPGAQFDLEDYVLAQGNMVLLFDRVGVWQKVFVLGTGRRGWVHHQTLTDGEALKDPVTLAADDLPTVLAMHAIGVAGSFPARAAVKVEIPKGAMFRSVSYNGDAALVVVPGTDSVMWVSRKDVQ